MTHPCVTSYDAPPPHNPLKSLDRNFAPSNDLLEGKKSTPVRTGALVRKLATGRAGVEFLIDAGDAGACSSDGANLEPLLMRSVLPTSGTLTGWGGSGREGKVLRQMLCPVSRSTPATRSFSLLSSRSISTPRLSVMLCSCWGTTSPRLISWRST